MALPIKDGLVEVEVVEPRLGRKAGTKYKVDPKRAEILLDRGLCCLPGENKGGRELKKRGRRHG